MYNYQYKKLLLYHLKPCHLFIRTTPLQETLVHVTQRSGITGGFYEVLMVCDVGGCLFWRTPDDLIASICIHLAELAMGERERAFLPIRRPGAVTFLEVTNSVHTLFLRTACSHQ